MISLEQAVENAVNAFWNSVNNDHPEANSGDIYPLVASAFEELARDTVDHWRRNNIKYHYVIKGKSIKEKLDILLSKYPILYRTYATNILETEDIITSDTIINKSEITQIHLLPKESAEYNKMLKHLKLDKDIICIDQITFEHLTKLAQGYK